MIAWLTDPDRLIGCVLWVSLMLGVAVVLWNVPGAGMRMWGSLTRYCAERWPAGEWR